MKLLVNGTYFTVTDAPKVQGSDLWQIRLNAEDVVRVTFPITGTVKLKSNGGFILSSVKAGDYPYQFFDGAYLTLSKTAPEPEPEPEPTPEPDSNVWDELANAIREGVDGVE